MTPLSETLLADYQIRKTQKQKTAFIEFMQSQLPGLKVEQGGFGRNRNMVLGDVKSAKVLLTAHYDTCARMIVPNFITPKNIPVYLGYSLLIVIPFLILMVILSAMLGLLTDSFMIAYWGSFLPSMALMLYVFMGGKPNPHTANDNTSGVITLCELWAAMTAEEQSRVALVFFDNEENGLLGSAFFRKLHKKDGLEKKLLINFDCVSDGDHMLFVLSKPARKAYGDAFAEAFSSTDEKTVYIEKSSNAMYPSDQTNFPMGVGVAALRNNKLIGLYMGRIHTIRDTVFQRENIAFFVEGTQRLLKTVL